MHGEYARLSSIKSYRAAVTVALDFSRENNLFCNRKEGFCMYDIWYYHRDSHSVGVTTVNSMDELYAWFRENYGYNCAVIITNICKHREPTDED